MQFVIHAYDKPNSLDVRVANRPDHIDYVKARGAGLLIAAPMIAEDGETPMGTVLIIEAENKQEAEDFAANDPYAKAGLFAEVRINSLTITMNNTVAP
jgi:uncharacterized protein YciI